MEKQRFILGLNLLELQTILSLGLYFCKMVYSVMAGAIRLN